ncbi:MAG: hypothetical protein AAGH41_05315 [Pseudomonadota bacterium]
MTQQRTYAGAGWTVGNILSVFNQIGMKPRKQAGDEDFDVIVLTDPATEVRLVCVYTVSGGEQIDDLALLCALPTYDLTADDVARLDASLTVATAFIRDDTLFVYAEPNLRMAFTPKFFEAQVTMYMKDLHVVIQRLIENSALGSSASLAQAFIAKQKRPGAGEQMTRLVAQNSSVLGGEQTGPTPRTTGEQQRRYSRPRQTHCSRCSGSGRSFFRACSRCDGTGLV